MWSRATSGSQRCFCSSVPNSSSGSATPIDWCADSSVDSDGVHRARQRQRAVVVDLREPEPAVLLGHLHAERAELLEPVDHRVGDARVALDRQRVDVLDEERAQALEEPLAALDRLGVELRLGMDQVEPQAAEEEVLAEARQLPLALAGLLGDLTGFSFGDLAWPCMPVTRYGGG